MLTRVLGIALLFAGAAAMVLVAGTALLHKGQQMLEAHNRRVEELERRRMAQHMLTTSWWFSEDAVTMALVDDLARSYTQGLYPIQDIEQIRERWRARRRASVPGVPIVPGPPIRIPADNKGDCHESRSKGF